MFCKSLGWFEPPCLFKIELSKELEEDDDDELDDELDDEEKSGSSFCDKVVLKRVIALRHANSVESTWACLNFVSIS